MKRITCLFTALTMIILLSGISYAGSGHYTNGVEGIKAATLPPEGFYWRMYNAFYNANSIKDKHGDAISADFNVSVYAMVNRFIYSTPIEFLGANLVADLCIPLQYTDISMQNIGPFSFSDNEWGLGDILLEPALLAWHGARYDAALGIGVYFPTGRYNSDRPASAGKGFWTIMPSAGFTFYFDEEKTWSASVLARYEVHTEQQDTDWTPGNDFHFEWGIGKTINKVFDIGLAGYCSWQVTDDWGPNAVSDREEAYAVGPEIGFTVPSWGMMFSIRSLWEFENKVNSEGNITTLTITKAF